MHDKRTDDPTTEDNRSDWEVLITLLVADGHWPWSVGELIRELGDEIATLDSIGRLQRGGLIHSTQDNLLYPSRAAVYFDQISG